MMPTSQSLATRILGLAIACCLLLCGMLLVAEAQSSSGSASSAPGCVCGTPGCNCPPSTNCSTLSVQARCETQYNSSCSPSLNGTANPPPWSADLCDPEPGPFVCTTVFNVSTGSQTESVCQLFDIYCHWVTGGGGGACMPLPAPTAAATAPPAAFSSVYSSAASSLASSETGTDASSSSNEAFSSAAPTVIYCGSLDATQCTSNLTTYCNASATSGACVHQQCSSLGSDMALCIGMGCQFKSSACTTPPACKDVTGQTACQSLVSCRWVSDQNRCAINTITCADQLTSIDCATSKCTWNDQGVPDKCFQPILASSLCRLVTLATTCKQQGCLWMEGEQYCEAWDVTCESLRPSKANCQFLPLCVYEGGLTCVNYDGYDFTVPPYLIVSSSAPSAVFPGENFRMDLIGAELKGTTSSSSSRRQSTASFTVNLHNYTTSDPCSDVAPTTAGDSTQELTPYDAIRKANVVSATVNIKGRFTFCIVGSDGTKFGPFGDVSVQIWEPELTACTTFPSKPFVLAPFELNIAGKFLDPDNARFMWFNSTLSAPDVTECPVAHASNVSTVYSPVSRVDSEGVVHTRTDNLQGNYTLCYINRGRVPAICPNFVPVNGIPPWLDMPLVESVASNKLPTIDGLTVTEYNRKYCKSMTDGNETDGVFTHPQSWAFQIGDGVIPYAGNEICAMAVLPQAVEGYDHPANQYLLTDVLYASLNIGDSLRIFTAATASEPLPCVALTLASCVVSGCTWDKETQLCSLVVDRSSPCPTSITGYFLRREITYDRFFEAGEKLNIGTTSDGGLLLVACMAQPNLGGLGVGVHSRVQGTYCPNDCKDKSGNQNGLCIRREFWECKCNTGYSGSDCSRRATCSGSGPLSDLITGASGKDTLHMQASGTCGVNLVIDGSNSNIPRLAKYGVGLRVDNVVSSANLTTDCDSYYILIRKENYKGDILTMLCPKDLLLSPSSDKVRLLVEDATSVYVEYVGYLGDTFDITYTAVSLVCPGTSGTSGIPEVADQCDGKGTCSTIDYQAGTRLENSAKTCTCNLPWAATFPGETCDMCAFGYREDTFPNCLPATICGRNCSNQGTCTVSAGCKCNAGRFGLDCQLEDDGGRLEDLQLEGSLIHRLPLNAEDVGNVVTSGSFDRTMATCALPGSTRPCRTEKRSRGRLYRQQKNTWNKKNNNLGAGDSFSALLNSRRQTNSSDSNATTSSGNLTDEGLVLNALATKGNYPDFIRTDNVTGSDLDVSGSFTVLAWVQLSAKSNGFLFAKVDSAFLPDGTSPPLTRSLTDVLDRHIPEQDLLAFKTLDSLVTHFAFYIDGENKMVSMLAMDPTQRHKNGAKDDWHYVRHFRLGDSAGNLFDGSWRWLGVRVYQKGSKVEGQIFVDGFTIRADPNYIQCLPWLPQAMNRLDHQAGPSNVTFGHNADGSSTIWGYRLKGALDELQVYDSALNPRTIPKIAGIELITDLTFGVLVTLLVCCALCIFFHIIAIFYFALAKSPKDKKAEAEAKEEETKESAPKAEAERPASPNPLQEQPEKNGDADMSVVDIDSQPPEVAGGGDRGEEVEGDDGADDVEVDVKDEDQELPPGQFSKKLLVQLAKYQKIRQHKHLELLQELSNVKWQEVHAKQEELHMEKKGKKKGDAHKGAKAGGAGNKGQQGSGDPASDASAMFASTTGSWQVISQMASGMEFPVAWVTSWGGFAHFFNFDIAVAFGTLYAAIFFSLVGLTFIMLTILVIINQTTKVKSKKELQQELRKIVDDRQKCLDDNTEYKSKRPLTDKIALVVTTVLTIFYMPVTNQALAVVFCHPNLMCIYDCYNDATHQLLVVVGIFTLVIITLGTPILFSVIVKTVVVQYHTYIGVFQADIQDENWPIFVDNVDNPFSSLYAIVHHRSRFFNPATFFFRALISAAIVALPSESASQLILCIALQLIYAGGTLWARSFRNDIVNIVVAVCQVYVVLMMLLRAVQLLEPENEDVGTTMVVISSIALVLQLVLFTMAIVVIVRGLLEARKQKKEREKARELSPSRDHDDGEDEPEDEARNVEQKEEATAVTAVAVSPAEVGIPQESTAPTQENESGIPEEEKEADAQSGQSAEHQAQASGEDPGQPVDDETQVQDADDPDTLKDGADDGEKEMTGIVPE